MFPSLFRTIAGGALLALTLTASAQAQATGPRRTPPTPQERVPLPEPFVEITEHNGYRHIVSNGIPGHEPGEFPRRGNPNAIRPQNHVFRVTLDPEPAAQPAPARGNFGVAVNGVPFEPGTAEFWENDRGSGWNYEALTGHLNLGVDQHHAHVQPTGNYHYHGLPTGLIANLAKAAGTSPEKKMLLIGYAADGFPIYGPYGHRDPEDPESPLIEMTTSYRLKKGTRPNGPGGEYDGTYTADFEYVEGLGDLDESHGRFGVTPEYPDGIYHYHITGEFPFISRQFHGTPDPSFGRRGPGPGSGGAFPPRGPRGPGGGPPRRPPPPR